MSSGCIERLLCFCGWDVSDWAKKSAVVIPIDPFQGFPFDLAHRFPRADLVDALPGKRLPSIAEKDLSFEQADDTFSQCIVIGVTDRPDPIL